MAGESFCITIEGCWNKFDKSEQLPQYCGVFFVFEAKSTGDRIVPLRLLYVGEADNVCDGILSFLSKFEEFKYVRHGNLLCYHTAAVERDVRSRVQAAFIYAHKPPANDRYKYRFPFAPTHILSQGEIGFLKLDFAV